MMNLPLNVDFTGKVVVVTGAGGVLCGDMARAYAQAGAKVAALDLNEEAVKKLADELKAIGAKFNRALSYNGERRAGWIISRRKADELAALLAVPQGQEEDGAAVPALPEPPAAVVYDPAQPIESAEFVAVDADGAPYGDAEKSQIPEAMRAEAQREEVRDWYMFQYPTDEEGTNIQAGATFADIMANPARVYGYIPADSIIRERVFRETANRYGVDYSEIDSRWLDAGEDSPAPSYGDAEKSPVPYHLADIYQQAKAKCAEAVALFHCGDWFTAYGEDADRVADAVGIIITNTRDGFRKASFPFAALDTYLPRMVRQGMKVCICDAPRKAEPSRLEKVAQEV